MALTVRQRTKINAALCMIHDCGHDASTVTALARGMMSGGLDARIAYQRALNRFAESNPTILPDLQRVVGLVEASDDTTVAKYDAAVSNYIETGDDTEMRTLAPMIAQDMTALAARRGEERPEFSPEFTEIATPPPSEFAFQVRNQATSEAAGAASQASAGWGPTGMIAAGAASRFNSAINQPINGVPISTGPTKLSLPGATISEPGQAT